jgi:hypothetical protein
MLLAGCGHVLLPWVDTYDPVPWMWGLVAADIDGDGRDDVLVKLWDAELLPWRDVAVRVYLASSPSQLRFAGHLPTEDNVRRIAVVRDPTTGRARILTVEWESIPWLDMDGTVGLVPSYAVVRTALASFVVSAEGDIEQEGRQEFAPHFSLGESVRDLWPVEIDGDPTSEIAVLSWIEDGLRVRIADAERATFLLRDTDPIDLPYDHRGGQAALRVGGGTEMLVVCGFAECSLIRATEAGGFKARPLEGAGIDRCVHTVAAADIDGNGTSELMLIDGGGLRVLTLGPTGTVVRAALVPVRGLANVRRVRLAVGDLNNDGIDDLLVSGKPDIHVWEKRGMAAGLSDKEATRRIDALVTVFRSTPSSSGAGLEEAGAWTGFGWWSPHVAIVDMNNDGANDIVVANRFIMGILFHTATGFEFRRFDGSMSKWPVPVWRPASSTAGGDAADESNMPCERAHANGARVHDGIPERVKL